MNRPKLSVLNALGLGYEAVARALWVLLVPVALDFFFWLGPHISIHTLFERIIIVMGQTALDPDLQQNFDEVRRFLSDVGNNFNLFSLLATDFVGARVLPIPTLKAFELPQSSEQALAQVGTANLIVLDSPAQVFVIAVVLLAVGLLIGALFMTLIADRVRTARDNLRPLPQRVLFTWLKLGLFVALLFGFYVVAGIPFMLAITLASFIHAALALLLLLFGWTATFWLLLFLAFVAYAMVLDGDGVLRAMWHSANVVRRNLLSTFGLIVLSNLILAGTSVIWQRFEVSWLGNAIAIIANAFVGSGLVAATFLFYQDRYEAWRVTSGNKR